MIQLVGNHRILGAEQRLEQAAVGVEAGAVEDRVFGAQEFAQTGFEILVHALRSADEPDRSQAVAPAIERRMRRRNHLRMLGQAQIIIRAQVQHFAPLADADMGILRREQNPLLLVRARGANRVELLAEMLAERVVHNL